MNDQRVAWLLVAAEVAALVAFFYYAQIAKDIRSSIEEFNPGDDVVRFVEWNTCAREALLTVVLLWFIAIGLALYEYSQARKSFSPVEAYRPRPLVTATLLLPVAGFVAAFILGFYLPRD
jgi:hypothetical protein